MPTPASQPDEQRLPSPVPRYRVLCFGSVGSSVSVPTECWSSEDFVTRRHFGLGANASSERQMPPPETPAQTVHLLFLPQSGETASAVIRLAVSLVAPLNDSTPGSMASCRGPYCCHWLLDRTDRPRVRASLASRTAIRL